jgi:hypothetical protein
MNIHETMSWLQSQPFAREIAESSYWFPIVETVHVMALTMVVGSVAMMDVRLLGIGRWRPASDVIAASQPWAWGAFAVAFTAGALLFCSKALTYYDNIPFRIKMVCMLIAGVNMLAFHRLTARRMSEWDKGMPPIGARVAGGLSLALWITIVALGRWIGFTY